MVERSCSVGPDPGALNLRGVYYVVHAALPHLIAAGGGKIVNVGSGARRMTTTEAYGAAKARFWGSHRVSRWKFGSTALRSTRTSRVRS